MKTQAYSESQTQHLNLFCTLMAFRSVFQCTIVKFTPECIMPRFCMSRIYHLFLRLYVRNFWSHEKRLPPGTLERLLMVLSSLYSARIEERFLSLATDLLLEMTSKSPDYTRNMFEFPLSECKFQVRFWIYLI